MTLLKQFFAIMFVSLFCIGVMAGAIEYTKPTMGNKITEATTVKNLQAMNLDNNKAYYFKSADGRIGYMYGYEIKRIKF